LFRFKINPLSELLNSILTQCPVFGVHYTFGYWKRKLEKQNLPELVEVPVSLGTAGVLKLNIGHQFQIEIPDGFSSATLGKILLTLKSL